MYALLPWKYIGSAVALIVGISLYAEDIGLLFGFAVTDQSLIRYLPPMILFAFIGFFGSTGYYAPWRFVWRWIPALNKWLPDLNGVWLGTTASNWPTIKKMFDAAQTRSAIDEKALHSTPERRDVMAVQITASLFSLKVEASLSSTNGSSHSITAKPRRDQHSGRIHLTYIYEQTSPNPAFTDEERHVGAADLIIDLDNVEEAKGVYWTRRKWQSGLNTAGGLALRRSAHSKKKGKSLREYAAEEQKRLETDC